MRLMLWLGLVMFLCSFDYAHFERADGVRILAPPEMNLIRQYNAGWVERLIQAQVDQSGANHYVSYLSFQTNERRPARIIDAGVRADGQRWVKLQDYFSKKEIQIEGVAAEFATIHRSERSRTLFTADEGQACVVPPVASPLHKFIEHGQRTLQMQQALLNADPLEFDAKREFFHYQHAGVTKAHEIVTLATSDFTRPLVSIGGAGVEALDREYIVMDAAQSPILQMKWQALLGHLKSYERPGQTLQQTLQQVVMFMRSSVFKDSNELALNQLIDNFSRVHQSDRTFFAHTRDGMRGPPVIPIDEFLSAHGGRGVGVCRHHALVLSYFLQRLATETRYLPPGEVFHIRDNVPGGAHVWTAFAPKDGSALWHVDSLWDSVANYADPSDLSLLSNSYGNSIRKIPARLGRSDLQ